MRNEKIETREQPKKCDGFCAVTADPGIFSWVRMLGKWENKKMKNENKVEKIGRIEGL